MSETGGQPSGRTPIRVVGMGVDSLYLAYRCRVGPRWAAELARMKASGRRVTTDPRTGEQLEAGERMRLGGLSLDVMPYGSVSAPFLARNLDLALAIAPEGPGPTVQAQVRARALWRDPTPVCVASVDRAVRELGGGSGWSERYVQRIDVCVDFQGWVPVLGDLERFVAAGRSTMGPFAQDVRPGTGEWRASVGGDEAGLDRQAWLRCKLTGFRIGRSGAIIVRLYDKTREIWHSQKFWFQDLWRQGEGYEPGEPVWRLEVQFRREALAQARGADGVALGSVEEVIGAIPDLWRYGTQDWLRLTLGDNERLTRATTHPAWEQLGAVPMLGVCDAGKVTRAHLLKADRAALVPAVAGYAASIGALSDHDDLEAVLQELRGDVLGYCEANELEFKAMVAAKRRKFATSKEDAEALAQLEREGRRARERAAKEAKEAIRRRTEQLGEDAWFEQEQASAMD